MRTKRKLIKIIPDEFYLGSDKKNNWIVYKKKWSKKANKFVYDEFSYHPKLHMALQYIRDDICKRKYGETRKYLSTVLKEIERLNEELKQAIKESEVLEIDLKDFQR